MQIIIQSNKQIQLLPFTLQPVNQRKIMSSSKQKLAQMVLQKMKQKKQQEQRNRPHYELLQLDVKFSLEENEALKKQVQVLTQRLQHERNTLNGLKQNLQDLQNTGKKTYPVIVIKPEFIASQKIPSSFKEFYRKTANTFLKADIIKTQKYQTYMEREQQANGLDEKISQTQREQHSQLIKNTKTMQEKRSRVLKQDVKRRLLIAEQDKIQSQIKRLKQENLPLLKEYQLKKQNLQMRIAYCADLQVKIQQEKKKIEDKYNPVTYREYLKEVFNVRIKNQHMEKNLIQVINSLNQAEKTAQKYKQTLANKFAINFIGVTTNSPSKFKGKMQKFLMKQAHKRSKTNPKSLTQIIDFKSTTSCSISRPKKVKTTLNEDMQDSRCMKMLKNKGANTERNYSSLKTLKNTFKSSIKSDRTMSTTLATSTIKKRLMDF